MIEHFVVIQTSKLSNEIKIFLYVPKVKEHVEEQQDKRREELDKNAGESIVGNTKLSKLTGMNFHHNKPRP